MTNRNDQRALRVPFALEVLGVLSVLFLAFAPTLRAWVQSPTPADDGAPQARDTEFAELALGAPPPVSVRLGPESFSGSVIGEYSSWTGLGTITPFWGEGGVEFYGQGPERTRIEPKPVGHGLTDFTVGVTSEAGRLRLSNMAVAGGQRSAIFAGLTSAPTNELRPLTLELVNVVVEGPARWLGFSYQTNVIARGVTFRHATGEHAWYHHGLGGRGSAFVLCVFYDIEGECIKVTYRPAADAYPPGMPLRKHATIDGVPWGGPDEVLVVADCRMRDFGGGIVLQGSGVDAYVVGCLIVSDRVDGFRHPAIGTEQGGEYYTADGQVGTGDPAEYGNGVLVIEDSIIYAGQAGKVMLHLVSLEALVLRRCAIYGAEGAYVQVRDVGNVLIEGCNTPALKAEAERHGIDTTHEPRVQGQVNGTISDTLIGALTGEGYAAAA